MINIAWLLCAKQKLKKNKSNNIKNQQKQQQQANYDTWCWLPNKNIKNKTKTTNNAYRLVLCAKKDNYNNNKQNMTPGAGCQTKSIKTKNNNKQYEYITWCCVPKRSTLRQLATD